MSRSEAERLRYTRTYVIESGCGDPLDDIGDFNLNLSADSFPLGIKSSRAIFTLHSFYVYGQTAVHRASASVNVDDSGFDLVIGGLGMSATVVSATTGGPTCDFKRAFAIVNKDAGSDNAKSNIYQTVSGGEYHGPPVLCSNPVGTSLNVKVHSWDAVVAGGALPVVPANANLDSRITFSIELIPDE